jgi:hypothetical protein
MITFRPVLYTFILMIIVSSCQRIEPQPTDQAVTPYLPSLGSESMKGFELYSWQINGQWYFSILIGTNREKTMEEIQASASRLRGIEGLQPVLESNPPDQFITWVSRKALPLPPQEILKHVQAICEKQGLNLGFR